MSAENGPFNFRLDKKFMNEREESARYYIQSMNKFHVNCGNTASWETFSTISARSRIGVKTKHILENLTGRRAALALHGVMQPDVIEEGDNVRPDFEDELSDNIYLL